MKHTHETALPSQIRFCWDGQGQQLLISTPTEHHRLNAQQTMQLLIHLYDNRYSIWQARLDGLGATARRSGEQTKYVAAITTSDSLDNEDGRRRGQALLCNPVQIGQARRVTVSQDEQGNVRFEVGALRARFNLSRDEAYELLRWLFARHDLFFIDNIPTNPLT